MPPRTDLVLSEEQRAELNSIAQSGMWPSSYVFRARLILMLSQGVSFRIIKQRLRTTAPTIVHWRRRFLASGIDGLDSLRPGHPPTVRTLSLQAKIVAATGQKPQDGSARWTCRGLAAALGVSKDIVQRTWKDALLKPHRLEHDSVGDLPGLEVHSVDIVALFLNPPRHAAIFCSQNKTALHPLARLARETPRGVEKSRYPVDCCTGALSLLASLDRASNRTLKKAMPGQSRQNFATFLKDTISGCAGQKQFYIFLDNLSAEDAKRTRAFRKQNPEVQFNFTLTYASWIGQVALWFDMLEREVVTCPTTGLVSDLARKLSSYIKACSADGRSFQWKHSNGSVSKR